MSVGRYLLRLFAKWNFCFQVWSNLLFKKVSNCHLLNFLVTFGVETFGVWLKKVLPPRAPSSHLPPVAASVANRPPAQPYHQTWRRVREGEPQESFNWFLENEQVGKTTDTSTFKTLLCQRQSQPFHSCRTRKVDTGDMVKILYIVQKSKWHFPKDITARYWTVLNPAAGRY